MCVFISSDDSKEELLILKIDYDERNTTKNQLSFAMSGEKIFEEDA